MVIHQSTGRRLGEVTDLLLDPAGGRVVGLVLDCGWPSAARAVPVESIAGMGPDAVVVEDHPIGLEKVAGAGARPWSQVRRLSGKPVFSRSGRELGRLDDVLFDEASGEVKGYRLSGGFISDLLDGRATIAPSGLTVGDEALLADGVADLYLGPSVEG